MAEQLSDRYNPAEVESRTYQWWESSGYFKAQDQSTKPPFSIILPPPNVTGLLAYGSRFGSHDSRHAHSLETNEWLQHHVVAGNGSRGDRYSVGR